jgi:outer membrane protein TolC
VKAIIVIFLAVARLGAADTSPFQGSVPSGTPTAGELALPLAGAIERGLRYNLGTVLAGQAVRGANAERLEALAQLLPNIGGHISESSQQINVAAFGFSGFPGVGQIIGPFGLFDARAYLSQTIFNLRSLTRLRAGTEDLRAAELNLRNSRDVVALAVTELYLQCLAGASRIDAARAQVATAAAAHQQAVDLKRNGMVPAIDVLRAQVELQSQEQRLIYSQNEFEKQKLRLGRAIGLPDGQAISLSDAAPYSPQPDLTAEQLIDRAQHNRLDYQASQARLRAAELVRKAAVAGRLPSLAFNSDYGAIGPSVMNSHGTFAASLGLNIPIFQGGRVRAEILQADAHVEQRRAEAADLRGRIAYEVRSALLDVTAAGRQAEVAKSSIELARQQVTQSRDRFAAGVTNTLEVVQAQQALAAAEESYITSLYWYNAAKAALARAVGGAEKNIPSLLMEGKL